MCLQFANIHFAELKTERAKPNARVTRCEGRVADQPHQLQSDEYFSFVRKSWRTANSQAESQCWNEVSGTVLPSKTYDTVSWFFIILSFVIIGILRILCFQSVIFEFSLQLCGAALFAKQSATNWSCFSSHDISGLGEVLTNYSQHTMENILNI